MAALMFGLDVSGIQRYLRQCGTRAVFRHAVDCELSMKDCPLRNAGDRLSQPGSGAVLLPQSWIAKVRADGRRHSR